MKINFVLAGRDYDGNSIDAQQSLGTLKKAISWITLVVQGGNLARFS